MPEEKKLDPFKPVQPSIPGLAPGAAKNASAQPAPRYASTPRPGSSSQPLVWIAVAAVIVFIVGGALFFWLRGLSPQASQRAAEPAMAASPAVAAAPKSAQNLPVGPGPVATTDELEKTWSAKRFLFRDPITSEAVPAMVVHLPGGSYWAFSLREPFGTCELEYISDLQKLSADYSFHADYPMVGNPCNRVVYDLLRYGSSDSGLVRGEIVQGSGIRPPMAIEVRVDGKRIDAVRME